MKLTKLSYRTILLFTLPLLAVLGCGGPKDRGEVSGTIRFNGEPLVTGSISFVPAEGNAGPTAGGSITDGEYHVPGAKGVAVGKNRVSIRSMQKTGRKVDLGRGGLEDEWKQMLPVKYNERSELVRDIQPGSNRFDFDLSD